MSNPAYIIEDAVHASRRAVQFDQQGHQETAAAYFYRVATKQLLKAADLEDATKAESLRDKARTYEERATRLDQIFAQRQQTEKQSDQHADIKKCYFLFEQGLQADEAGQTRQAVDYYTKAIELGLTFKSDDKHLMKKMREIIVMALERAEKLKGIASDDTVTSKHIKPSHAEKSHLHVSGQTGYTDAEKRVLSITSNINNITYVPFMSVDLAEQFRYAIPFTDADGYLALAPKQKRDFVAWCRPDDICPDPKLIAGFCVDCFTIKQTVISDCSFVASLAVSANYEKRFQRPLITSIIYPRNSRDQPIYNPFGKYMIKLHLNGVTRKIVIDDHLPIAKYNQLLCSYSSNRNEFWVSLLEKAYMKVMGGYDFPGSNSNIDLHALTGWIPERVAIKRNEPTFNSEGFFDTLLDRHGSGDVLATVATGDISDAQADLSGLVATHAYAVLDVKNVNGVRLMLLKNPWSHLRWKGNYSELDAVHWTDELRQCLRYNPDSAAHFDNGVFWIDYDSLLNFFDVFYLNWNPQLFKYTYCIHESWNAGVGPVKDAYNIGDNPQFYLDVEQKNGAVWILLTRHIMQLEDFKENREYITVLVYKNNGDRVYYPNDPEPFIDGTRINSPHYLCKIKHSAQSPTRYTLVVSQYEKTNTIYYTLRAYSTGPFTLRQITNPFVQVKTISGEWKNTTAGGCANHPTFKNNPRFHVELTGFDEDNVVYIDLKGPREYAVGLTCTIIKVNDDSITAPFVTKASEALRSGFVYMELKRMPAGVLEVMPSTFYPNEEGPFILTVKASCNINITRVK